MRVAASLILLYLAQTMFSLNWLIYSWSCSPMAMWVVASQFMASCWMLVFPKAFSKSVLRATKVLKDWLAKPCWQRTSAHMAADPFFMYDRA